jgi:hypothetical protein
VRSEIETGKWKIETGRWKLENSEGEFIPVF